VPESDAVPSPLSVNVTPVGRAPVSLKDGCGTPVAMTAKVPGLPTANIVELGLVIAGAVGVA
jgi:hypothetical protein